jgi:hypothetical protein
LGQEREHPLLAAAALGDVVLLDQRVLAVEGMVWKSRWKLTPRSRPSAVIASSHALISFG